MKTFSLEEIKKLVPEEIQGYFIERLGNKETVKVLQYLVTARSQLEVATSALKAIEKRGDSFEDQYDASEALFLIKELNHD